MITTAVSIYHKQKAGHCVTSFLHVVSGPNGSFALKLIMLVNNILRGDRSKRQSARRPHEFQMAAVEPV